MRNRLFRLLAAATFIVAAQAPQQDFLRTATNNVLLLY